MSSAVKQAETQDIAARPMTTRYDKESRRVGSLHRSSDRGTGCQERFRPERVTHRTSRLPTELPDRPLEQPNQAAETLVHLQKALDGSSPAANRAGRCYRVCFMNRFARGRNTITACQRSIVVPSAESREAAIEVAKQRFAELEGIPNWQIHASFIEAGLIEDDAAAARAKRMNSAAPMITPTCSHPSECGTGHGADPGCHRWL